VHGAAAAATAGGHSIIHIHQPHVKCSGAKQSNRLLPGATKFGSASETANFVDASHQKRQRDEVLGNAVTHKLPCDSEV